MLKGDPKGVRQEYTYTEWDTGPSQLTMPTHSRLGANVGLATSPAGIF